MEGWGHQPSHKTLDPQLVLPTECSVTGAEQNPNQRLHPTTYWDRYRLPKANIRQSSQEVWDGRWGRIRGSRGSRKGTPQEQGAWNQLTSTHRDSWRAGSLYRSYLGALHVCYGWEARHPSGNHNSGNNDCPDSFAYRWDLLPTRLPFPALTW